MPIYTYKCAECNNVHDYLVKLSDPVPPCSKCQSTNQTKEISTGTGVCFMGHGWTSPGMTKVNISTKGDK